MARSSGYLCLYFSISSLKSKRLLFLIQLISSIFFFRSSLWLLRGSLLSYSRVNCVYTGGKTDSTDRSSKNGYLTLIFVKSDLIFSLGLPLFLSIFTTLKSFLNCTYFSCKVLFSWILRSLRTMSSQYSINSLIPCFSMYSKWSLGILSIVANLVNF